MGRDKKSSEFLEDAALTGCVFGILMDRTGFVEVTPAVFTIWCLGSRFDQDLMLHVAGCYVSCIA
jgi:hypothetical protein